MYSNKENINILTALLVEWGVADAVVCPGSRNAAIVHNLSECPSINCFPVTDERSAAFYALGIALATKKPTVVCVTSGSALLNTTPAVAEAFYRHVPLVVVAADRPVQWIDQLDGQTLPQPDALNRFVRKSVSLPEPRNDEEHWFCNRLVNEALHAATFRQPAPVLINVPISEPLFTFDVDRLPAERRFCSLDSGAAPSSLAVERLQQRLLCAQRPMVVVGQMAAKAFDASAFDIDMLAEHFVVLAEPLSNSSRSPIHFDEAVRYLCAHPEEQAAYTPDYIIYIGDTLVSKATRNWLRRARVPSCFVTPDPLFTPDPLMNLHDIATCDTDCLPQLMSMLCDTYANPKPLADDEARRRSEESRSSFHKRWRTLLDRFARHARTFEPAFSQMATVKHFELRLDELLPHDAHVHYANSSAVRLAAIYARHYVWCNRGVNGIEGSLSTAAGFSLTDSRPTFCVIGDLSFFYDQNALWNRNIGGNLRILLLNNRGGSIFKQLPGLNVSPVADSFVGAQHGATAQGICTQNNIVYLSAQNKEEMERGIDQLLTLQTDRPVLLEVFTDADRDVATLKEYYKN